MNIEKCLWKKQSEKNFKKSFEYAVQKGETKDCFICGGYDVKCLDYLTNKKSEVDEWEEYIEGLE